MFHFEKVPPEAFEVYRKTCENICVQIYKNINIFMSFQYFFMKFEILLVHDMRYKSCYKIFFS